MGALKRRFSMSMIRCLGFDRISLKLLQHQFDKLGQDHIERHHGPIVNSNAYPFALSLSKGSERIATQSPTGEDKGEGAYLGSPSSLPFSARGEGTTHET